MLFKPGELFFWGIKLLSLSSPRRKKCVLAVEIPISIYLLSTSSALDPSEIESSRVWQSYPVWICQGQTLMVPQWLGGQLKKFLPLAVCYSLQLEFIPSLLSTLLHHWGRLIIWVLLNQLQCAGSLRPGVPVGALWALPWDGHLHPCIRSGYPALTTSGSVPTRFTRGHGPYPATNRIYPVWTGTVTSMWTSSSLFGLNFLLIITVPGGFFL